VKSVDEMLVVISAVLWKDIFLILIIQQEQWGIFGAILSSFCRFIDALVEADRKGYKIRVSNDKVYVNIMEFNSYDLV
jgi:hypothetical protein